MELIMSNLLVLLLLKVLQMSGVSDMEQLLLWHQIQTISGKTTESIQTVALLYDSSKEDFRPIGNLQARRYAVIVRS